MPNPICQYIPCLSALDMHVPGRLLAALAEPSLAHFNLVSILFTFSDL